MRREGLICDVVTRGCNESDKKKCKQEKFTRITAQARSTSVQKSALQPTFPSDERAFTCTVFNFFFISLFQTNFISWRNLRALKVFEQRAQR